MLVFEWHRQKSPANLGHTLVFRYTNHVCLNGCSNPPTSARLCALEALMQFGGPARKHSTNIMSVMEDDVYLVRLPLGKSTR